jgi:hypothetical protein
MSVGIGRTPYGPARHVEGARLLQTSRASQFARIIGQRLADTLNVVERAYLTRDELGHPYGHSVSFGASYANVEERLTVRPQTKAAVLIANAPAQGQ